MEINFATLREIVGFVADLTAIVLFAMKVSQRRAEAVPSVRVFTEASMQIRELVRCVGVLFICEFPHINAPAVQ